MPKTLGVKFNNTVRRLGNKIDNNMHMLGHKANTIIKKSDRAIQTGNGFINKVDRGLQFADKMGAGALPYAGPVFEAMKTAIHKGRDITNRATNISNKAKGHTQDLEKFNARKFAYEALQDNEDHDKFA
jgi:hypothetical protein